MKAILLALSIAALFSDGNASRAEDNANAALAPPRAVASCAQCHGPTGNSTAPTIPRLNGQQVGYLEARMEALRDPTRQTPQATHAMWDLATHISDADIPAIAEYFASQQATAANGRGGLAEQGKKIYESGAPDVPACQTCHGARGDGHGTVPRLAGQHSEYLAQQLLAFKLAVRTHGSMDANNRFMTSDQIKAVTSYLGMR